MAIGSRQSTGPLQISEIDIHLINDVLKQIQDRLDILTGLTGQNLSVSVADASAVPVGSIVKALTATTLEPAVAQTATVTGDYVAPGGPGSVSGMTVNKVPKGLTAKTLTPGVITDSGTSVTIPVLLDLSGIAAGATVIKYTSTTDTPTTVWSAGLFAPTAAPIAYLEVIDGVTVGYIPVFA